MRRLLARPLFWIAVGLAVAVAVVAVLWARGPAVTTTVASRRVLEQHIVASGRVRVPTRVQVSAQVAGLVVAVGAVEGQRVRAGDLLVKLDDGAARAAVAQAEAAVTQAKARVDQLARVGAIVTTEALRQTESTVNRAQVELERTEQLAASGVVTQTELDDARHAVEIARAQRNAAEAQQVASAPMGADSRVALGALLQARAQLTGAKVHLEQTRLVALHNGRVLTRSVEPGDVVQPSRTLLVMAADADVQLVVQLDERNLAWVQLGQPAMASSDAYPQHVFEARVSYIAPSVDPQRGSIEVHLDVPRPPAHLKPDMTVSIDLTVAVKKDALTLRSDAVRGAATPSPWVLTVERGRVTRREVQLGIRGEGAIEIVSGIDETSQVIVGDGRRLAVGARVRAERD